MKRNVSNQIVIGIDGISQRIIDITDKKIKLDYLLTDIAPLIFKQKYALLKLNYVFNYDFETQKDYNELEKFWRELIELRIKSGNKTMIQIAPTPFTPEYFIPLQYFKIKNYIDSRFEDTYMRIKSDYFDNKKITPLFKMEGLQGYKNYFVSIIIHRLEDLSDFVYFCFKNNYASSKYSEKLYDLLISYLKKKGLKAENLLAELNTKEKYYFNRIDWSGGNLDYIDIVANRAEKMKQKAYSN
jgi:hypothetical protein